jgi:hypothetical protein
MATWKQQPFQDIPEGTDIPDDLPSDKDLCKTGDGMFMGFNLPMHNLILPYEQAVIVLKALQHAQLTKHTESYESRPGKVLPLREKDITTYVVSKEDYLRWKTNAILLPEDE